MANNAVSIFKIACQMRFTQGRLGYFHKDKEYQRNEKGTFRFPFSMRLLNKIPYSFAKNNHDVHTVEFLIT